MESWTEVTGPVALPGSASLAQAACWLEERTPATPLDLLGPRTNDQDFTQEMDASLVALALVFAGPAVAEPLGFSPDERAKKPQALHR